MEYISTRGRGGRVAASQAIASGLAPDGGLYVPDAIPKLEDGELSGMLRASYIERASWILLKYLDEFTAEELADYAVRAYGSGFSHGDVAPLRFTGESTAYLELWHGPTAAFKDMALQMLPHLLTASLKKTGERRRAAILAATSGDTGKAALEGFRDVDGTKVMAFYPVRGVSETQRLQMVTQEGANVNVCAVEGNFDDTQTGVKAIFGEKSFAEELTRRGYVLSSANSINWGRLLPQIVYYVSAYCDYVSSGNIRLGDKLNFCVPTGNFGNILAAWYAKAMGLPIGKLICASNRNNILTDFMRTGVYDRNRDFYCTMSPSMDILISSNLERLLFNITENPELVSGLIEALAQTGRYDIGAELTSRLAGEFYAGFCDEADTMKWIAKVYREDGYLIDTHTAVGRKVLQDYRAETGDETSCVVVSTASPYKFCGSVYGALTGNPEPDTADTAAKLSKLTGLAPPEPLTGLDGRAVRFTDCVEKNGMKQAADEFLGK